MKRNRTKNSAASVAPDTAIEELMRAIQVATTDGRKVIGHFGGAIINGQYSTWMSVRYDDSVPRLLTNPDYKVAQVLSVLGSEVRLSILRALLESPRTAAELVAELRLGTTGQAYHHLRELERAGYVEQRGGHYHFDLEVGHVYLTALALAADGGAEAPDPAPETHA
jgi:DNA-binding transcriptional ArsR family regulator